MCVQERQSRYFIKLIVLMKIILHAALWICMFDQKRALESVKAHRPFNFLYFRKI